ncbi:MAG: histidine kinase [Pedobacter sp.]|nr:MAG: histidine kinase [Pedobacter sp.]
MLHFLTKPNTLFTKIFLLSFSLFSFLFPLSANAQIVDSLSFENVGKKIRYIEDPTQKLRLSDIQQLPTSAFTLGQQDILNFGNTKSAWWLKIEYKSPANKYPQLLIDASNIEAIEAYVQNSQGELVSYRTGSLAKQSEGVIIRNSYMLNLPTSSQTEVKTIYIRLQSNNILLAPIKITSSIEIFENEVLLNGLSYICFGLLIGLLLYNLFIYFSIRDITYLYYVIYVFTLSCYILLYLLGFAYVFGDEFRNFLNTYPHAWIGVSIFFVIFFCRSFLELKYVPKGLLIAFYSIQFFAILIFIASILGQKAIAANLTQGLSFISPIIVGWAGVLAFKRGHKAAVYYNITWVIVGIAIILLTVSLAGFLEVTKFTFLLIPLSSIMEVLVLSFALGDRYSVMIASEKALRDENLLLIKTQNQRLEKSVAERTLQLNQTITQLEDSNEIKNKLFSIIAHDLKSPLNSLIGILSLNDMQALSMEELRDLLAENKKSIDSITNTINNLLHWAKGQMEGTSTQLQTFELKAQIEELYAIYLPLIKQKEINFELQLAENGLVHADPNQIQLVIRNLLDNAIKFTPVGGAMSCTLHREENHWVCTISNVLAADHLPKHENLLGEKIANSTLGTQNEKGVGLGLLLCREYLSIHGSTLQYLIKDRQIQFSFALKAV